LRELPKLTALTLASAIGGGGGTGSGGSTVFGILLALFALTGCFSDPSAPSAEVHTVPQLISCRATVATGLVECGGPQATPTPEIIGGQGRLVALRSSNVSYAATIFQADVSIQNLASQTLGGDAQGIDVFFVDAPTVTGGTGTVTVNNPTGNGTFTHSGQDYFHYSDSIPSLVTSSALNWKWNVPATVTSFSFNVELSAGFTDAGGVLLWSVVPELNSDTLSDIAVNSSTDAMAVGRSGLTYRKIGTTWSQVSRQTFSDWVGLEAIGNGQYLGATAFDVYLFDGKVWKLLYAPGFQILSVSGESASRIVVGGVDNIAWLGTGGWHTATNPGRDYRWVGALGSGQAVALATFSSMFRISYDSPTPSASSNSLQLTAFYGGRSDGNFGFGVDDGSDGFIYDDGSLYLYGPVTDTTVDAVDFGATPSERWAVVRSNSSQVSVLMHLNAGVWSTAATLPDTIIRMTQDSAGGLYFLSADGIRRWNGIIVDDELVAPQSSTPAAIDGGDGFAFVGMNNGDIRRFDGTTWTNANPGGFLQVVKLHAFSANTAVALDTVAQLSTFDGVTWSPPATFAGARDIWGTDATHMVLLQQNGVFSFVWRGDPFGSFTPTVNPNGFNSPLNAVWGSSVTDFWVAGNAGVVLYFNGSSFVNQLPGTASDLFAMAGTGNSDVWVAGGNGYIAHWDGASWTACTMGSATIKTLVSPRPGVVYVGTGASIDTITAALCRYMGAYVPTGLGPITAMDGPSASDMWAISGKRVYWGHR
jgi:hypothetical protein